MQRMEETRLKVLQETIDGETEVPDKDEANAAETDVLGKERASNARQNGMVTLAKRALYKNLGIVSASFLLLFSAFHSLQNLQSSINVAEGLGNIGLTVLYVTFLVSCAFLPPLMLSKLGMKRAMVISMFGYISYIAAAFHATWWTVIPASVVVGVLASTLWTGQMSFVTELARFYSDVTGSKPIDNCSRFFGIFYAVYHTGRLYFFFFIIMLLLKRIYITSQDALIDDKFYIAKTI